MSGTRSAASARTPLAVTYDGLPISSGGFHSLGRMPRRVAFDRVTAFIEACTEPIGPVDYWFNLPQVPDLPPQPHLEQELERRFGKRGGLFLAKPDRLVIGEDRVAEALDFLDDVDPQPMNQWGMAPIWLWMTASFRLLDPSTGRQLPGQDPHRFRGAVYAVGTPLGTSELSLILHNRAQLGIQLCIPDADTDCLNRVIPWLQDHLPCSLSPKHWLAWTSTRSDSLKARHMTPSL